VRVFIQMTFISRPFTAQHAKNCLKKIVQVNYEILTTKRQTKTDAVTKPQTITNKTMCNEF